MKKEKIIFIISLVMMLLATSISVYATSCLYNSSDVSYTAPTGSGLSANVQDSLTEVYGHCTDYTSMDTRVSSLEGHFQLNPNSYFFGSDLRINPNGTKGGYVDFYFNSVNRAGIGVNHSNGDLEIVAKDTSSVNGKGNLNINASSIKFNGTSLGDLIKAKTARVSCSRLTQGFDLSSYISLDSGYKFLAWESVGSSEGWVTSFPIYISNPVSTSGGVFWNGTLDSQRNVIFTYFEIKDN